MSRKPTKPTPVTAKVAPFQTMTPAESNAYYQPPDTPRIASHLTELQAEAGTVWCDVANIVVVGAPFQVEGPGRPKTRLSPEEQAERDTRPYVRCLWFRDNQTKLYVLDTTENLAALGL